MRQLTVIIPGEPVAKGRPRMTRAGRAYTPRKTEEYEQRIRRCWHEQNYGELRFEGRALWVTIECFMPIPASLSMKKKKELDGSFHTKKPDLDNMVKAVLDGLNETAYADDSIIASVTAVKKYSDIPHVKVVIGEI